METQNQYLYPVEMSEKVRMTYDESPAHVGQLKYAVDFIVPEGTPVKAAAAGVVVDLKADSNLGGEEQKAEGQGNFIEIKHENGEYSEYEHLKKGGAAVKVGDQVAAGQVIGYSGATGWLAQLGPHLHFMVGKYGATVENYETLEIVWAMKFDEEKLKETIKPYLTLARAGDWEHALRVVRWVKELGNGREDLNLLITAAYIHDIGWSGVAPKGKLDLAEMLKLEPRANKNSRKLIAEVLAKLPFTDFEIQAINRLVAAADQHLSNQADEAIIVDADNLSKLCLEHLEEKYQPESFVELLNLWKTELPGRIKTEKGKELLPKLLLELEQKVNKM